MFFGNLHAKKLSFVCILQYRQKLNRIFQLALLITAEKILWPSNGLDSYTLLRKSSQMDTTLMNFEAWMQSADVTI